MEECQIAFDKLKDLCTSTPILAYANYRKPFQLQTDASDLGLGAECLRLIARLQGEQASAASWEPRPPFEATEMD